MPNAASSYSSYEFTASIVLVGDPVPIRGIINNGNFYGASIGGGSCGLGGCNSGNIFTSGAVVDGRPIITTMVVPLGGASFMKEFFDVSMTVSNLAPAGFTLKGGRTALELPTGLSLASTTNPQAASVAVPDIPGGGSKTTSWTVQGDSAGSYDLAASYTATLDPSGRSVSIRAATKTPLKVWGATAVEPVVEVDPSAAMDHPFGMRVGVKNVASVPIYNATIDLKTDGAEHYLEQPEQKRSFSFAFVPPGQTAWSEPIYLVPDATGDVDVTRSVVRKVAGDASTTSTVTTRPRRVPIEEDPVLDATSKDNAIELDWDPVPGARGYKLYRTTTDRKQPWGKAIAVSPSTKATIKVPASEPSSLYAVSAIVNGKPVLRHPIVEAASGTEDPDDDDGTEDPNGKPEGTCETDATHKTEIVVGA